MKFKYDISEEMNSNLNKINDSIFQSKSIEKFANKVEEQTPSQILEQLNSLASEFEELNMKHSAETLRDLAKALVKEANVKSAKEDEHFDSLLNLPNKSDK